MNDWLTRNWHPWIQVKPNRVFVVTYPSEHEFEDTVAVFRVIEAIGAAATQDYGVIVDMGKLSRSDARGRSLVAESEQRINATPSVQRYCRGVAFVVSNTLQRGVMTAINWFSQRPYEYTISATREEADAWTDERMAAAAGWRQSS